MDTIVHYYGGIMRKLIPFILLFLLHSSLFAQIKVIGTSPANGAYAVDQDSIVLEFNLPVYLDPEFPEESGFYFTIEPYTSFQFDSVLLSEDNLSITIFGQLSPDVDYVALLESVVGQNGEDLDAPYIFQFTTASQPGPYTVSGVVSNTALDKLKYSSSSYKGVAVILLDLPLEIDLNFTEGEEPSEEDDVIPMYATIVDSLTGEYTISGVREGSYYPVGMNIMQTSEMEEFKFPDIYWLDQDQDFIPDSILVNSETTTLDTLPDVNLTLLNFNPILLSDADSLARSKLLTLPNDPVLMGGSTFYFSISEEFGPVSKAKRNIRNHRVPIVPKFHISPDRPFRNQYQSVSTDSLDILSIISDPSGYQIIWEMYAYDSVKDSVIFLAVTPFGTEVVSYLGIEEAELPGSVSFSDIKPMPENYLDSDEAVIIFEELGGSSFRDIYSYASGYGYGFWELDIQLLHEFWDYTPNQTPSAPVLWKAAYYGSNFNMNTYAFDDDSLLIYLDASTGELLYTQTSMKEAINFSQAVDTVRSLLATFENTPTIVGGETEYQQTPPFEEQEGFQKDIQSQRSFLKGVTNQTQNKLGYQVNPNGYQLNWNIYAYDAVKDSALAFFVSADTIEFSGYFGSEEAGIPPEVEFTSIKPLPENFIGSEEAVAIMESNGGLQFRQRFSENTNTRSHEWQLWLLAMHDYWDYEENPTSDVPVMWSGRYYGNGYDFESDEYTSDSLFIFLDVETGEILYTLVDIEKSQELPSSTQLFQNYPNPFNPVTTISFELNQPANVKLHIFNLLGQKVATLVDGMQSAGNHSLSWDASNYSSGFYFYRLETLGTTFTRKLLLLK